MIVRSEKELGKSIVRILFVSDDTFPYYERHAVLERFCANARKARLTKVENGGMSRYMRQVGIKTRKYVSLTRSEGIKLGGKKK